MQKNHPSDSSRLGCLVLPAALVFGAVSCEDSIRPTRIRPVKQMNLLEILSPIVVCSSSKTMDLQ